MVQQFDQELQAFVPAQLLVEIAIRFLGLGKIAEMLERAFHFHIIN